MGVESEERIKKELNVEDVIIIDFKFNTGKNVDQTLTKNEVYRYSATYIKGTNQEWECYEMGHK